MEEFGGASTTWQPWYELSDNIYGGIRKINGFFREVDQGVRIQHAEFGFLSDDDELVPHTLTEVVLSRHVRIYKH